MKDIRKRLYILGCLSEYEISTFRIDRCLFDAIRTSTEKDTIKKIWFSRGTKEYDFLYQKFVKFIDIFEAKQKLLQVFYESFV